MMINLNDILDKRQIVLRNKITELDKLKDGLRISEPIEFSISDFTELQQPNKDQKVGIESLNNLENIKDGVVYIFEIVDPKIREDLLINMGGFRSNPNIEKRTTTKIPKNANENKSKVLYVGSVEKNIHTRIKQHLGYGSQNTYALQLKYWANEDWKFKFYYIKINNKQILKEIEAQISKELNPLVGKREK